MWRAWMVTEQQADTPIPLVEDGSRQTVPRRWLAMGVDAPGYEVAAGPVVVADIDAAVEWALAQGYKLAPSWGSEVL